MRWKRITTVVLSVTAAAAAAVDSLYAGDYLAEGFGARAMALGGAYASLATDAAAPAFNPAGLAWAGEYGGLFMHSSRFSGLVAYDTLTGFWCPDPALGTFALAWLRTGYDDIKLTRWGEDGQPEVTDVVDSVSDAFELAWGRELWSDFAVGVTLKYLHDDLVPDSASSDPVNADGFGFDVGLLWRPAENASLALVFRDPYTVKTWNNDTQDTFDPRTVLGGSWSLDLPDIDSRLLLTGDAELILADYGESAQLDLGGVGLDLHGGLEFEIGGVFSARIGADRGLLALGGGVHFWKLALDYCWLAHDLGDTHRISLQAQF